jgi:hypothetical protein
MRTTKSKPAKPAPVPVATAAEIAQKKATDAVHDTLATVVAAYVPICFTEIAESIYMDPTMRAHRHARSCDKVARQVLVMIDETYDNARVATDRLRDNAKQQALDAASILSRLAGGTLYTSLVNTGRNVAEATEAAGKLEIARAHLHGLLKLYALLPPVAVPSTEILAAALASAIELGFHDDDCDRLRMALALSAGQAAA